MKNEKLTNEQSEFRTGDKILFKKKDKQEILTLQHIALPKGHEGKAWKIKEASGWLGEEQFRHATDEEIYWLETLGRKRVGDFRIGDAVLTLEGAVVRITTEYTLAQTDRTYNEHPREIVGIYPEESFKQFSQELGT